MAQMSDTRKKYAGVYFFVGGFCMTQYCFDQSNYEFDFERLDNLWRIEIYEVQSVDGSEKLIYDRSIKRQPDLNIN